MRLALLYWGLFAVSAIVLLAVTITLWQGTSSTVSKAAHGQPAPSGVVGAVGHPAGAVQDTSQHSSDLDQLLIVSGIAVVIVTGPLLLLGWLAAGRFLRPLRRITATTREISATNLHQRLNLAGPDDELKELGDTFDELLARLERAFAFERQFVANASHELRTPLAGMRTSLDVAMAKAGPVPPQFIALNERLRRELGHVDRLLDGFLTLAHTQQGPVADQTALSLADLTRSALERRSDAISALQLQIKQSQSSDARVTGSETLVSRMVENVIDNSICHNQPGGWIQIITTVDGPDARLVVENGGPVLPAEDVTRLTRPFQRVGAQRTGSDKGSGLGLAIVSSIVDAHGGTLDLNALSAGGLQVVITLPLAVRTEAVAPT